MQSGDDSSRADRRPAVSTAGRPALCAGQPGLRQEHRRLGGHRAAAGGPGFRAGRRDRRRRSRCRQHLRLHRRRPAGVDRHAAGAWAGEAPRPEAAGDRLPHRAVLRRDRARDPRDRRDRRGAELADGAALRPRADRPAGRAAPAGQLARPDVDRAEGPDRSGDAAAASPAVRAPTSRSRTAATRSARSAPSRA